MFLSSAASVLLQVLIQVATGIRNPSLQQSTAAHWRAIVTEKAAAAKLVGDLEFMPKTFKPIKGQIISRTSYLVVILPEARRCHRQNSYSPLLVFGVMASCAIKRLDSVC